MYLVSCIFMCEIIMQFKEYSYIPFYLPLSGINKYLHKLNSVIIPCKTQIVSQDILKHSSDPKDKHLRKSEAFFEVCLRISNDFSERLINKIYASDVKCV